MKVGDINGHGINKSIEYTVDMTYKQRKPRFYA